MTILLALLIDRFLGEPPARLHPVIWMGQYLEHAGRRLPDLPPWLALPAGAVAWAVGAAATVAGAGAATWLVSDLPAWLELVLLAFLLKPMFALTLLLSEVAATETALREGLAAGRARLGSLVSRDTAELEPEQVREAAIESLAENLSDSLVAPLFWFLVAGLPGAALYRFANTADAMWGYRGRWEWAGKVAARADDLLNLIPARLTALALLGADALRRDRRTVLAAEARRTASPNSGWPMAAMAMALGLRLGKPGHYVLNEGGTAPGPEDLPRALERARRAGLGLALLAAVVQVAMAEVIIHV
ncbi:adenosylcobinamide-phosphate synthase CbiB [Rhodospirillum centenum]|uniref:Cobalamin biosynthesis protein CobD n=1 Tax=Rhodospirillum centenum (strain ATCC 51521 / SW) TaxID=414684 RepID=B6IQN4_RHOCS|nr:adenosylcobinamide-phosphate synthase CbiB [Rhodospirillum centenum]ACI97770.1 cobalamin biosynthesis protein CobD [Rhodospirillum centenum SW]